MTAPWKALYCEREDQIIHACWMAHQTADETKAELAKEGFFRSRKGIQCRRRALGLSTYLENRDTPFESLDREYGHPGPQSSHDEYTFSPASLVRADIAFKEAMLGALYRGEESVVLGVVKDRRPFSLKTMQPEPTGSGCGSPAYNCWESR